MNKSQLHQRRRRQKFTTVFVPYPIRPSGPYPPDPLENRILDEQAGAPITDEQADAALLEE